MPAPGPQERDLLIDHFLPHPHFQLVRHAIVDAPVKDVHAAIRELDYTDVPATPLRLRLLPHRLREHRHGPPRRPTRLTADDLDAGSAWVILGDEPGTEFVLGVVGKFWRPVIAWHRVEADEFSAFEDPGYGKLAVGFSTRSYGPHRSLLTLDTRVVLTDPESWLKFRRYWRISWPFVRALHTALLRTTAADARHRALTAYTRSDQD